MKKHFFFIGLFCLVLLLVSACTSSSSVTTTIPYVYTNNTSTALVILGEVVYESKTRPGYIELLKAARNLYPDCDYLIDIMIDQVKTIETNKTVGFFGMGVSYTVIETSTWVMRGTAIKYKY